MTDERCKQIMEQLGYPESKSLMVALFQVANETEQAVRAELRATPPVAEMQEVKRISVEMEDVMGTGVLNHKARNWVGAWMRKLRALPAPQPVAEQERESYGTKVLKDAIKALEAMSDEECKAFFDECDAKFKNKQ